MMLAVTVLLENSRCSAGHRQHDDERLQQHRDRRDLPSSTHASQRAAPVSKTTSPSDRPATISMRPPHSISRSASFHVSTRTPGQEQARPPASADRLDRRRDAPPSSRRARGVSSHVAMTAPKISQRAALGPRQRTQAVEPASDVVAS